ncbi:hypothetical protein ACFQU1_17070 [Chelatococcus sp. GCM10030263]|uniref:hypothetical protein n=1 Tax=Chelatococcus sp. GCM10030263 TaxID=3273387 RepID=UPI003622110C
MSRRFRNVIAVPIAAGLVIGVSMASGVAAPLSQPSTTAQANTSPDASPPTGDSPDLKAFRDEADAALKALDEKAERRDREAKRAMRGICTGCFDNLRQDDVQAAGGPVYDPYDTTADVVGQDIDGQQPMSILPDAVPPAQ